jgi:hypothetical protein
MFCCGRAKTCAVGGKEFKINALRTPEHQWRANKGIELTGRCDGQVCGGEQMDYSQSKIALVDTTSPSTSNCFK